MPLVQHGSSLFPQLPPAAPEAPLLPPPALASLAPVPPPVSLPLLPPTPPALVPPLGSPLAKRSVSRRTLQLATAIAIANDTAIGERIVDLLRQSTTRSSTSEVCRREASTAIAIESDRSTELLFALGAALRARVGRELLVTPIELVLLAGRI